MTDSTTIRPIHGEQELNTVFRLTHDAYVEQGYCLPQPNGLLIHYPHLDAIPETTVLVAVRENQIIGTISWTLDGPKGLHVDGDFKEACDRIRAEGRRLAASWRIVVRKDFRGERAIVTALIQSLMDDFRSASVETAVFTFAPKHEHIYQKLLRMRTVAHSDGQYNLNSPAVFMRLELSDLPKRWISETPFSSRPR